MRHTLSKAMRHLGSELSWYRQLTAQDRALLNLIIETAAVDFLDWMHNDEHQGDDDSSGRRATERIFVVAPVEFTQTISLKQTLEVTRLVVTILEQNMAEFAEPGQERQTRDALLRYAREVAFTAASVYASAAEARGQWDTRLETMVVEDLAEGRSDAHVASRMGMLGWHEDLRCFALVGRIAQRDDVGIAVAGRTIRRIVHARDALCLLARHGDVHIVLLSLAAGAGREESFRTLLRFFDKGPVCIGPSLDGVHGASRTIRDALSAYAAAPALVGCHDMASLPRPLSAEEVLPERALAGDRDAADELVTSVYGALRGRDPHNTLFATVTAFLLSGGSLETSARKLNVHPNTVRYRLKRSAELTGWDPMDPRESYVLLTAIKLGVMRDASQRS